MNITQLGILKQDLGWQQILEQEGIIFNTLSTIPAQYLAPIIVNRQIDKSEIPDLQTFIKNGGAILTDFPNLKNIIDNFNYQTTKISYILNDGSDSFNNITAVDLELPGYLCAGRTRIYQSSFGKGYIIALPFDVNQAICDTRNEQKPFYYPSRKFPNEIVSVVSKGAVRKLVVNCLRTLFNKMNLPYVHLWYYPKDYKSVFSFRVDTDYSPEKALKVTYDLEEKTDIRFTYFVNTKEHPNITNSDKDFQIHCYIHKVFKDYQKNYDNIKKAKSILEYNSIKPIGFVSPFGLWNENLQKAMEDCGIQYSSEFSLSYDDLPFFPIIENKRSNVLQIPVHPICIGRLVHAGLTPEKCFDYYKRYFAKQVQANEPLFIYDHPHRIAQFPDVFILILNNAKKLPDIWLTNMTEFYHWWKVRLSALSKTKWQIENQSLKVETQNQDSRLYLHIITPNNKQAFVPLKQTIYNLKDLGCKSILMTQKPDNKNYKRLKSKRTRLQMNFYQTIDAILHLIKR